MKVIHQLFLEALNAALQDKSIAWSCNISDQQWQQLFNMACTHHVLPMIYTAVCHCPAISALDPAKLSLYRSETLKAVTVQTMKTAEFLKILHDLSSVGLHPLTVKGLICRELYPHPDYRDSGDEDLLIPPDDYDACQKALSLLGLYSISCSRPSAEPKDIAYGRPGSPIYIELHPAPFPSDHRIYGSWNHFFRDIYGQAITIQIHGQTVRTMNADDHLFYLICHALKHFCHSGFGLRQICDIVLFAGYYGKEIHWQQLFDRCQALHALRFAAAIFKIGMKYLDFDPESACYPYQWQQISADEGPLLSDLLDAGLYGDAAAGRKHSSLITLHALQTGDVSMTRKSPAAGWLLAAFPDFQEMARQYPWLCSKPWCLPAAWYLRWQRYLSGQNLTRKMSEGLAAVKTGAHRTCLMQYYQLIPEKHRKKGGFLNAAVHGLNKKNKEGHFFRNFR